MASNPYVNKVKYGDQTVMDISDSTADENDVAAGEVFYKANGARSVGTASSNYYSPTDATSTDIDDADYIPFYDNSASAKKNSLWSNIKAKLNEIFFRRSEANVLGAKNLFKRFPVDTYTIDDVVFTQNANGSITVNGTVGSSVVTWRQNIVLKAGSYIVSGGVSSINFVGIYDYNTTQYIATSVEGSDEFTLAQDTEVGLTIRINKNQTVNNIVFYPMLRFASDPDGVYQPFAMTNKELTDKIGTLGSAATKDVPTSGDAGQTEVVLGSDSRLTDARTPTSHTHTTSQITDFPTLATVATSGNYSDLTGTPTIPDELADLSDDSTHRLVTDTEKSTWDGKQDELTFDNIPTANSSNPVKSGGVYTTFELLQTSKADNSVIAPVEGGTTASRAYAVGEHFIRDGAFCTAKAAISAGGTFTLNTNYVAGQINLKSLFEAKTLTPSHNLNNITDYGLYAWTSSNAPSNVPETGGQTMMVLRVSTTGLIQLVLAETALYTRCYFSTGWTTWRKIPSTAM